MAGRGWMQREGGQEEEVAPGNCVWFPVGEKHRHGATETTAMSHVAVMESVDGSAVMWLEHVADADYAS